MCSCNHDPGDVTARRETLARNQKARRACCQEGNMAPFWVAAKDENIS